jgi:alpha-L-fucosidase
VKLEPLDTTTLPAPVDVSDNRPALAMVDAVIEAGPYDATWESLSRYRAPHWYGDAKFGISLHWGAFSVPAFGNEWYPRTMYQRGTPTFDHHMESYGPHNQFGYKDFLPHFRMENYDPQAWVALFKRAGAQFVVPVAEHHDGYAMYDTARSRWKVTQVGPKRDVMGDLLSAVDDAWLITGASTHRAEHWFFMNGGMEFDSDVRDVAFLDLYGPALRREMNPTERFLEDWLLRTVEIIDSYRPQILSFDTGIEEPSFEPYIRRVAAYYYNRAAEWGREVVINYTWDSFAPGSAMLDIERGTMPGIRPDVWRNGTSVSRTSWGWVEDHDYKDASELIQELVDVVSKNGNLLLNVGPRPDGTIPEEEAALLEAIGRWLAVHGEAIYGSSPWVVFGEGPTAATAGSFTDAASAVYTAEDIRFTRMTEVGHDYVYGIGLVRPEDGRMRIRSFGTSSRLLDRPIIDVRILGSREQPEWTRTGEHLEVVLPDSELAGPGGAVVRLELAPEAEETRIDFFHGLNL